MATSKSSTPDPADAQQTAAQKASFENQAPDNIPRVDKSVGVGGVKNPELEDYEGCYKRKSDGEDYALAIVQDTTSVFIDRTHKATNTAHYWEGNEAQFREQFTEEDGSPIKEVKPSKKKEKK